MTDAPVFRLDPTTKQVAPPEREAEHWQPLSDGRIECSLCYRACVLADGERGWCGYRENRDSQMVLSEHSYGVISAQVRQMRGYQVDPFLTYKPGSTSVFFGGTRCTAGCVFCMSKEITWNPERVPWPEGIEGHVATSGGHYGYRAMLMPEGAIEAVHEWGAQQSCLGSTNRF